MATAAAAKVQEFIFEWEGKDKNGKVVRGEMRAGGEAMVGATLRRQGILITKVKKRRTSGGRVTFSPANRAAMAVPRSVRGSAAPTARRRMSQYSFFTSPSTRTPRPGPGNG